MKRIHALAIAVLLALGLARCEQRPEPEQFVARVGNAYLTEQELAEALEAVPAGQDSLDARRQIIEQWVTNELLYQEARRRDLSDDPDVQRRLEENERSVLINALISTLYEEEFSEPSPTELQTYYERHKDVMQLREPYVRIRYLVTRDADTAATARRQLQRATASATADSLWPALVRRFSTDTTASFDLSDNYYPERRLFADQPAVQQALSRLRNRQMAPVIETETAYHVLQLVERVPAGTTPKQHWIRDELIRRLTIQARKQMYARQVQRLRNEALARDALDIR